MKIRFLLALVASIALVVACGDSKPAQSPDLVVGKGGDAGAEPPPAPAPQSEDDAAVPILTNDATRGSRLAAVTMVVFSDFQCPFCSRVAPTLDRLYETYGAEQLRIVFKNNPLPFHQHARIAAEIGQGVLETVGNEAFWRFHNTTFEHQKDMEPATLLQWAVAAGADERTIKEGIDQRRWSGKIDLDMSTAHSRGANGTPTTFIDGVEIVGARGLDDFKAIIDEELPKSRALVKDGIPRDQIYTRLAAQNFKSSREKQEAERKKHEDDERQRLAREAAEEKIIHKIPVGKAPTRGNPNAQVTIIEFADFQCPYCKNEEQVFEKVKTAYGDKVRFVWRDFPLSFHPRAEPAAELARFALATKGEAGFWAVHDALFASTGLEDADLEAVATANKLDVQKAMAAVKAKTYASQIEADQIVGEDFEVGGTPHFFVNGRHLKGAKSLDSLKSIIDEEIARADELLKKGASKTALYDALIKDGVVPPEPPKKAVAAIPANAPFRGTANAKLVIQEFADFQCPFCAKVKPTIDELLKSYPGKIKVVWRDDPLTFHPDAPLAAEAAREAYAQKGNEGWQKFTDLIWANQRDIKRVDLETYAQQVGLDMQKFGAALDKHTHKAIIDAESKAATDAEIGGTPAFFVGPYFISGAKSPAAFKKVVNLALALPADKLTPEVPKPKPAPPTITPPTITPPTNKPLPPAPTSLVIADTQVGTGREVKSGDKVKVHYVGRLLDGTEFDASRKHGNDGFGFRVGAGQVIKGWDQGLVGMKVGGKRKLTIPPDLAYGDRGAGSVIPPKATLVFDIELLSIE